MRCLWDFFTFQHIHYNIFYPIAIFEILLLIWVGFKIAKNKKKRKIDLITLTIIMFFVMPPIEILLTCYPIWIAYSKSIMLIILMWIGVGMWHLSSKIMGIIKKKQH
jgi:hypothetical protein